jgi:NitT/TauT family transport system substrate-binding protein
MSKILLILLLLLISSRQGILNAGSLYQILSELSSFPGIEPFYKEGSQAKGHGALMLNTRFGPQFMILLILVLNLAACNSSVPSTPALTPITVQLSWTHQAQFAGFYAADQNGDYAAEGLVLTFIEGGPNISPSVQVAEGQVQFGVTSGDQLLLARGEGQPVQGIATIYRRSPRVYIALAESGIKRPQDFVGKTISVGQRGQGLLDAMMGRVGISPDQYTVVASAPDLVDFYADKVQLRSVFLNNEVLTAQQAGHKLNIIYPDDYGIHFYSDTLFTTDDLIADNPDLVLRFVRATLKGWTWAVENPMQVGPLVAKYNPAADIPLETDKMTASLPLVNTGEDYLGWMKPEVWAGMEQTLREQGVLTQALDMTQVYRMQFLEEIYHR